MNRAAFGSLWLFVFVIPWEEVARFPYAGSLGRVVGLAACLVGVLYVLIRGRVRPLGWCHVFVLLFVLWGAVGLAWSVDLTASGQRIGTYAQLGLFAWLIWELAWSRDRQLALLQAYVLGAWVLASSDSTARTDIEDGYLGVRGSIWKAGVALFVQHPLAGVGAGTFATAVEPLTHRPEASHQTFLSVLVEQGVIGFALFVGILVSAFLPVRRFPAPERKLWIVMLLTLCVGLMPANWDYRKPLWFLVGVLAAWAATGSGSRSMARAAPRLAAGASPKADGREVAR